jgi:hypothetical protein
MRFSTAFSLGKSQAELDFVDVDLDRDTPLYLDPYALSIRRDDWSRRCTRHIVSYFQSALDSVRDGDTERTRGILSNLGEPNETCLGNSQGRPSGRGMKGKQTFDLYEALRQSEAAKSGLLSEIAEFDLFIPGIGPDKISDLTTNVTRSLLVEYTQRQCDLHAIAVEGNVPAMVWDLDEADWQSVYVNLPIWHGKPILLVPKASVRFRLSLDSQEYYNHFMLNFLQAEHLRVGSALVKTFKRSGRDYVTKESLKEIYPFSKNALFQFTKQHPELLEIYKRTERSEQKASKKKLDADFDEAHFCDALASRLRAIPPGTKHASDYHSLMIGALEFIFYPNLIYPMKEKPINDGRKRIDITYTNAARDGFFFRLHTSHHIASLEVMVECKNYSGDVANPELDQLVGRFSVNRGRLGILLARHCESAELFIHRCRDVANARNGIVIPLFDADIHELLEAIKAGRRGAVDAKLDGVLRRLIS